MPFLLNALGERKTLLKKDIPKALNITASKVVLHTASSEYIKLMGRNGTIEQNEYI